LIKKSTARFFYTHIYADRQTCEAPEFSGTTSLKLANCDLSEFNHQKAIELDPCIVGLLEYQGDLLIKIGKPNMAEANFAKLGKVCWPLCDEES